MPTNFETFQCVPVTNLPTSGTCNPVMICDKSGFKYYDKLNGGPFDAVAGTAIKFLASSFFTPVWRICAGYAALPSSGVSKGPNSGICPTGLVGVTSGSTAGTGQNGVTFAEGAPGAGYSFPYIYAFQNNGKWNPCLIFIDTALSDVGFNAFDFTTSGATPCGINTNNGGTWGATMLGYRFDSAFMYALVSIMDLTQNQTPASHIGLWKIPFGQSQFTLTQANALYWDVGPLPPPAPATWYGPGNLCGQSGTLPIFSRAPQGSAFYMADAGASLTWIGGGVTHGEIGFLVKMQTTWRIVTPTRVFTAPASVQAWLDRFQAFYAWQFLDNSCSFYYTLTLRYKKNGYPLLTVGFTPSNYAEAHFLTGSPSIFTTASWSVLDWDTGATAEYVYGREIPINPLFPTVAYNSYHGIGFCGQRENGVFCGVAAGIDGKGYYFEIHRTYAKGHSSTAYQFNLASLLKG